MNAKGTAESLEARIALVVSEVTGIAVEELGPETRVREDLKADSMQVMTLMIALDAEFDVEFNVAEIPDEGITLDWIRRFVEATLAGGAA